MSTEYRIHSAGTERPMQWGRETGEQFIAIRLQVGKRSTLETIRLSNHDALKLAADLVNSVRREVSE